jgi:membrane associated rhomboid family serine protease
MPRARQPPFHRALHGSLTLVALLFLVEFADLLFRHHHGFTFDRLGIIPRSLPGLIGIAFSPLLHGDLTHLAANTLPLIILLTLLFWDRSYQPWSTLASIWIVSGLGTWLIGRSGSIHIGASSIIFGLVAYLILSGFLLRKWRPALIAIVIFLVFGGIFYGVLPQAGPISWEGHLCGAAAGLLRASQHGRSTTRRNRM